MKKIFFLAAVLLSFSFVKSTAQVQGHYIILVQDDDGNPISNAKLVVLSGQEHFTNSEGTIAYYGEEDYAKKNGKYVKIRSLPHYITIKAAGFKENTVDLTKYKIGTEVVVNMGRPAPETKSLLIHVKDKKGKPIEGASITVMPGTAAETDASGSAKTTHRQLTGEYITVIVTAGGYKNQQKQVMAGQNRKTYGGFGAVKSPDDEVDFLMESAVETRPLVIEVLDSKDNKPVNGASVRLKVISSGEETSASTRGEGEARFTINIGDELRAMVSSKGYKEKWSDISAGLTTDGDHSERRFLVYLTKEKEEEVADWNGTFKDNYSVYNFSGGGASVSANWTYTVSDSKGTGSLSGTKKEGNKISGTWQVQHQDDTKTGARKGTFTLTLSGDTISGELVEDTPSWNYKPGFSSANVNSSMKKGAVWPVTINRKK